MQWRLMYWERNICHSAVAQKSIKGGPDGRFCSFVLIFLKRQHVRTTLQFHETYKNIAVKNPLCSVHRWNIGEEEARNKKGKEYTTL